MHSRFSLHKDIINQNLAKVISDLKENFPHPNVNLRDKNGFTALQLAAREGLIDISLWLLCSGATVDAVNNDVETQAFMTALNLAIEYGHPLVAQILLAFGANKATALEIARDEEEDELAEELENLHLKEWIKNALIFWMIKNSDDDINLTADCENVMRQPTLTEPVKTSRFVEFAAQNKKQILAKGLLRFDNERHIDPSIFSAGYWAAQNNQDIFNQVCENDAEWLLLLRQLSKTDRKIFETYFAKAKAEIQGKFMEEDEIEEKDGVLTKTQKFIYCSAAAGSSLTHLQLLCRDDEDYYAVMNYAFVKKNFVAMYALDGVCDLRIFLENCLSEDNGDLLQFWIIATTTNLFELALGWQKKINQNNDAANNPKLLLQKLLDSCWNKNGLLNTVASNGVQLDKFPARASQEIMGSYPPDIRTQRLEISIYNHYGIILHSRTQQNRLIITDNLSYMNLSMIRRYMGRFGIDVIKMSAGAAEKNDRLAACVSRDVWQLIISFFDLDDMIAFNNLSHYANELILENKGVAGRIEKYAHEIEALEDFISQMVCEIQIKQILHSLKLVGLGIVPVSLIISCIYTLYLILYPMFNSDVVLNDDARDKHLYKCLGSIGISAGLGLFTSCGYVVAWEQIQNLRSRPFLLNSDVIFYREFSDKLKIAALTGYGTPNHPETFSWAKLDSKASAVLEAARNSIKDKEIEYIPLQRTLAPASDDDSLEEKTSPVKPAVEKIKIELIEDGLDQDSDEEEEKTSEYKIDIIDTKPLTQPTTQPSYLKTISSLWRKPESETQKSLLQNDALSISLASP